MLPFIWLSSSSPASEFVDTNRERSFDVGIILMQTFENEGMVIHHEYLYQHISFFAEFILSWGILSE